MFEQEAAEISLDVVENALRPFHAALRGCVDTAWKQCQAAKRGAWYGRTDANLAYQLMVNEMRSSLGSEASFQFVDHCERLLLIVDDKFILRPKKLRHGRVSGILTQQAARFESQLPLKDLPALPRVTLGYVTNAYGTAVHDVRVLFLRGRHTAWSYSLSETAAVETVITSLPLPAGVPEPVARLKTDVARANEVEQSSEKASDGGNNVITVDFSKPKE